MAYSSEDLIEPFWAEYTSAASGRDPLAIQNSSVVIYTKMMVGITNVTNRIRYNGFYCWLFETILQNISKKNSYIEQIRYLRRAELLLAYMMVREFPETTGVSGSAYAGRNMKAKINLRNGADWEAKKEDGHNLYWQFKGGVFGQYYSGVVRELNLINHPQGEINIYTTTDKGKQLGIAFGKNIPKAEQKLFWGSVSNGSITETDLTKLTSFALHNIQSNTDEIHFYEKMLLSNDDRKLEPTFHRQQTINLMLQFLEKQKKGTENLPTSFLKDNYKSHFSLKQLEFDTATAWYLFEINELLHVSFEHFHSCFLYSMEEYPTPLNDQIESLLKETESAFKAENVISKTTLLSELLKTMEKNRLSVYDYYDAMEAAFRNDNNGECLMNAMQTILCVYSDCKKHLSQLDDFAILPENNFNRKGYATEIINDLIPSKINLTINDCIKSVLLLAINLHTFSSYTKTKVGQSLVHNYMIEDNSVWRLRETLPNRTTPRLQNAVQYISDIGWMKRDGKNVSITDEGIKIIKSK
ncbi:MAG TPA: hypothetical protein VIK55_17400 [Paludibacter sp.]